VGWSGGCCRPGDHGDRAAPTALSDTREKGFVSSLSSCVSTPAARLVATGRGLPKARQKTVAHLSNVRQTLLKIVNQTRSIRRKSSSSGGSAPLLGVIDPTRARSMTPRQDRGDRSRIERHDCNADWGASMRR
jgi:hypothetical protein